MTERPYLKFYPSDWRGDPRLRMCSLAARGLWIDLISYMHEGSPYGHLTIDGNPISAHEDIASLIGRPVSEVRKAMAELQSRQVFSTTDDGVVFSRRMVRDHAKSVEGKQHAKTRWGNRAPNGSPNGNPTEGATGEPNTYSPESRVQSPERKKKDAAEAAIGFDDPTPPPPPDADLYRRGKEILGRDAGGLIKRLLVAKGNSVALARAAIEQASTKHNPREYIGACIRGPDPPTTSSII